MTTPDTTPTPDSVRAILLDALQREDDGATLNALSWRIAESLGDVPEGADQISGDPLDQADRLIADRVQARRDLAAARAAGDAFRRQYHQTRAELERIRAEIAQWPGHPIARTLTATASVPAARAPEPGGCPDHRPAPAVPVDRIAQAIGDPGSIVGPRRLGWRDGGDDDAAGETVTRWATRAVLTVIAETASAPAQDAPRGPATPDQGDGQDKPDHGPHGAAEAADSWSHVDPETCFGISIEPMGAAGCHGWRITTDVVDVSEDWVHLDYPAAVSLHTWLGQRLGRPTPATPEPGPQDITALDGQQ